MCKISSKILSSEARIKLFITGKLFDETRIFYQETLALNVKDSWDEAAENRGVMFDVGSVVIELIDHGGTIPINSSVGLSLKVVNVWELWLNLKKRKVPIGELYERSWGDTDFQIFDPAGFELMFFTPTGEKIVE